MLSMLTLKVCFTEFSDLPHFLPHFLKFGDFKDWKNVLSGYK